MWMCVFECVSVEDLRVCESGGFEGVWEWRI